MASYWPQTVTALITVLGWISVHRLSLRAQRINLRNQAVDRARAEIARALREYQFWLGDCKKSHTAVTIGLDLNAPSNDPRWTGIFDAILERNADGSRSLGWALRMEEYEIVFPETRAVRRALLERQGEVRAALSNLFNIASRASLRGNATEDELRDLDKCRDMCDVQQTLIEDLLVHLQNVSLGAITGNVVPLRVPGEAGQLRIEKDERSGLLLIRPASQFGVDASSINRPLWSRVRRFFRLGVSPG